MTLLAKLIIVWMLAMPDINTTIIKTKGEQNDTTIITNENPHAKVLRYTQYYASKYKVPEIYLFRLLKLETGFRASDTAYNPFSKYVLRTRWDGPFQMLTSTARSVWPDTLKHLTKSEFRTKMRFDLEFSTHTAVKYISMLYKKYGNWKTTFAVYNLGPRGERYINKYAHTIVK